MGRDASLVQGNRWYEARMEAAKWNEKLSSREGVFEETGITIDQLKRIEGNLNKVMPVDSAVLLADLYNAPELCNYYCKNECPIGCRKPISDETHSIDRLTVKLLQDTKLSKLESLKNKLLDIAADGEITEDEYEDFEEIMSYLNKMAKTISEMQILGEKVLNGRKR